MRELDFRLLLALCIFVGVVIGCFVACVVRRGGTDA